MNKYINKMPVKQEYDFVSALLHRSVFREGNYFGETARALSRVPHGNGVYMDGRERRYMVRARFFSENQMAFLRLFIIGGMVRCISDLARDLRENG